MPDLNPTPWPLVQVTLDVYRLPREGELERIHTLAASLIGVKPIRTTLWWSVSERSAQPVILITWLRAELTPVQLAVIEEDDGDEIYTALSSGGFKGLFYPEDA